MKHSLIKIVKKETSVKNNPILTVEFSNNTVKRITFKERTSCIPLTCSLTGNTIPAGAVHLHGEVRRSGFGGYNILPATIRETSEEAVTSKPKEVGVLRREALDALHVYLKKLETQRTVLVQHLEEVSELKKKAESDNKKLSQKMSTLHKLMEKL